MKVMLYIDGVHGSDGVYKNKVSVRVPGTNLPDYVFWLPRSHPNHDREIMALALMSLAQDLRSERLSAENFFPLEFEIV